MRWLTFLDESIKVHSFIKMFRQTLNVINNSQQSISNAEYAPYVLIELTESINLRHNFYFVWSKYGYVNTIMSNSKINTKVWIFFSTTCTHGIRRGNETIWRWPFFKTIHRNISASQTIEVFQNPNFYYVQPF